MDKKRLIVAMLDDMGAFWSGKISLDRLPRDETIMEKGLLYLEFEDMHLLFEVYGKNRLKKFWRENLVPQGSYYSTINWMLALYFFGIKDPDKYLKRYGKSN